MARVTLSRRNLSRLAHAKGFRGVAGLARRLGRNRVTLYQALKNPNRYKPTVKAMQEALDV